MNNKINHTIELHSEEALLLPERVALGVFDLAGIVANNTALALNAGTFGSVANAAAGQVITVTQS